MGRETIEILLVEDSETHAIIIQEVLESGHLPVRISLAKNLAEARAFLRNATPQLAIIDLLLPDGNGIEMLPADKNTQLFPVVIMSGQGNEPAAVEAMKAGAMDYVVKSAATLNELPRIVQRVLREWKHIAQRRRAEEELRERDQQYLAFFENNYAAMLLLDPESLAIVDANPAACSFYGYTREELTRMKVPDINTLPPEEILLEMERAKTGGRRCFHFSHKLASGAVRDVEVYSGPSTFGGKNLLCSIVHDITERMQAEKKLKESNRELDAFVYTVSHDLRTPLALIIGYADFLLDRCRERLDKDEIECLAEITASGERMAALMEDLLTLAKVGQIEPPAEPFAMRDVVDEVVCELAETITRARVSVNVGNLPTIRIPKTLLAQIFHNLIGNAVHYAGREGSSIEVGGERRGALVRLHVCDHGPGVPVEERSRIFDVFHRSALGRTSPGTGVGLATVQKIARLYQGRAWIEETKGGGSTFLVEMVDVDDDHKLQNLPTSPGFQ